MRLIPSFCALACASALPLAAPAQTAAEPPAPETAPETAGRTVLDVTASGTLTGLAADALGPDAALTVRLHGPVAFDVDTTDFASLEIFADDPAVKYTVSETAAYDRITAVSIPAASGEPAAAAAFTAAAASAGIATLAEGDTTTDGDKYINVNVVGGKNDGSCFPISSKEGDSGLESEGWSFSNATWVDAFEGLASLTAPESVVTDYTPYGTKITAKAAGGGWATKNNGPFALGLMSQGFRDGAWEVDVEKVPFSQYSLVLYMGTDTQDMKWCPVGIAQGGVTKYYYYDANDKLTFAESSDNLAWGSSQPTQSAIGTDVIKIPDLTGDITFSLAANSTGLRGSLTGFQIIDTSEDILKKSEIEVASSASREIGPGDEVNILRATLNDQATLTLRKSLNLLKVIGPETGKATLEIATDVDFSKIDFSEAANVTFALNYDVSLPVPSIGADAPVWPDTITQTEGKSIQVTGTLRSGVKLLTTAQTGLSFSIPGGTAGAYRVAYSAGAYYLLSNGELSATVTGSMDWGALSWSGEGLTEGPTPTFAGANVSLRFQAADDDTPATLTGVPENSPIFATLKLIGAGTIEGALNATMTSVREDASVSFTSESASLGTILVNPGATATFPKDTVYDALDNQGTVKVGVLTKELTVESGTFVVTGKSDRGNNGGNTVVKAGARLEITETGRLYAVGKDVHVSTPRVQVYGTLKTREWQWGENTAFGQFAHNTTNMLIDGGSIEFVGDVGIGDGTRGFSVGPGGATLVLAQGASYRKNNNGDANISFPDGAGALTLSGPGTFVLKQTSLGGKIKLSNKATLSGTSSISTLAFGAETVLDASDSTKILTATALEMPSDGTVAVTVAENAAAGTVLLKKSAQTTAEEAKKFVVTGVDNAYVTTGTEGFVLGKVNTENLPAGSTALAGILNEAQADAIANGVTTVALAYGQSGGKTLTAGQAEAGAELFTGITKTTTDETTATVTVAYDFGITGITVSGNDIVVTAKVQNMEGETNLASFASGTTVKLYKGGQATGATGKIVGGTVTFTLFGGLGDIDNNTAAKFTVKAEKTSP